METIKCGRMMFDLKRGDTVMDNGACYQLITRTIRKGWNTSIPRVSKAEFKRFTSMDGVDINPDHNYDDSVTLWTFSGN